MQEAQCETEMQAGTERGAGLTDMLYVRTQWGSVLHYSKDVAAFVLLNRYANTWNEYVFCVHQICFYKLPLKLFFSCTRMMTAFAVPLCSTGTKAWFADWSGKATIIFAARQYHWVCCFSWIKAWNMVVIIRYWKTITDCPVVISSESIC